MEKAATTPSPDQQRRGFLEARKRIAQRLNVPVTGTQQYQDDDLRAIHTHFNAIFRELQDTTTHATKLEAQIEQEDEGPTPEELALDKLRLAAAQRAEIAAEAVQQLASLLPEAKKQAKRGKPALLRLILRASR